MQSFQFHPAVARWFEQTFGSPTEPQMRGWPAIQSGRHVLISAPTGSGKTLAAFLASLAALTRVRQGYGGQAKNPLQRIGLSATQKPIEEVARFLVGAHAVDDAGNP